MSTGAVFARQLSGRRLTFSIISDRDPQRRLRDDETGSMWSILLKPFLIEDLISKLRGLVD